MALPVGAIAKRSLCLVVACAALVACGGNESSGGDDLGVSDATDTLDVGDGRDDGGGDTGDDGDGADAGCTTTGDCEDGDPCTDDLCGGDGTCSNPPSDAGTACGDGGDACDGEGACVECVDDSTGSGRDSGCAAAAPICVGGACVQCAGDGDCADEMVCDGGACVGCRTDEACDDGLPCTDDSCDRESGECVHDADDDVCGDGLFCNGAELCAPEDDRAGDDGCASGTPPGRADGVACTVDACDEEADAMVHAPDDGACDDGNPCTVDDCDPTGGCVGTAAESGTLCAGGSGVCDGTACADCADTAEGTGRDLGCGGGMPFCVDAACVMCLTTDDCGPNQACEAGVCVGCTGHEDCDDGVACTVDSCDPETTVCRYTASHVACDDALFCNGSESCDATNSTAGDDGCVPGAAPVVDDGVACTSDRCDEEVNRIVHEADHGACDDDNECTADSCSGTAGCSNPPLGAGALCDDDERVCDGDGGCTECADDTVGGVDSGCTSEAPSCDGGTCIVCDAESDACPLDCEGTPDGTAVEDACGTCDTDPANNCIAGCDGGPCFECDATDPGACDDLNPCTDDVCVDGMCINDTTEMNGLDCIDTDVCTFDSSCLDGACVPAVELACDGPCETGVCDPVEGCTLLAGGAVCDDGNADTVGDRCTSAGNCLGTCDDGNPCTFDITPFSVETVTCELSLWVPEGMSCGTDADPCTEWACDGAGTCVEGVAPSCVDCDEATCEGQCLTGACNAEAGCIPVTPGTECDDGDPNSVGDACDAGGRCVGTCRELECGQWMGVNGACSGIVLFSFAEPECPQPEDPCMAGVCEADGTCAVVPRGEGASCEHPCGGGTCNAEGVCELTYDACSVGSNACWTSSCDLETGTCVRESDDPACELPTAICDPASRVCDARICGDGYCPPCGGICAWGGPDGLMCGTDCLSDCVPGGAFSLCMEPYNADFRSAGAWRAHQSTAYGWPATGAHQTESFSQMLSDGLRWLHLVVDYCTPGDDSGPLCLCDGNDLCGLASVPLVPRLEEIAGWMEAHTNSIVTLYIQDHVADGDLRNAFAEAGADDLLYERTVSSATYEPWPMTLSNMIGKDRRLVVFAGGFLSPSNVLLADSLRAARDPANPNLWTPFDVERDAEDWECFDSRGRSPADLDGFNGIYALVHAAQGPSTWAGAACYNEYWWNHNEACEVHSYPHVMFFDFYNASDDALRFAGFWESRYQDRCIDDLEGCISNDDCDSGVCGGLFICLTCVHDGDCPDSQYCNTAFGSCLSDQADGALCTYDSMCQSGNCDVLCTSCESHADCDEGEWCDAFGGCQPKKARGFGCVTDAECISDACRLAFCADCGAQEDCASDQYCDLSILPGESRCVARKETGTGCVSDFECATGNCHATVCSECDEQADCTSNEYCTLDLIAPIESTCEPKRGEGESCATSVECATGTCAGFVCADTCESHGDCGDGRWCDAAGFCQDESANGAACLGNVECTSGNCFVGFCVDCNSQDDCSPSQYCNLDPLPGASTCVTKVSNGNLCGSDFECTSGNCHATVCSECDEHSDCTGNEYCTLDVIPPINSFCETKKANGSACGTSVECVSNQCTLFECGECVNDAGCPANENCNAFNECAPDVGNNQPCLRDSQCTTDICVTPLCAECRSDADCPAAENCDAGGDCAPDVGNNQPCLRGSQCTTGICSAGLCAECTSDGHCPAAEHCNVAGDCVADLGNNAVCTANSECASGICSVGLCAECTSDSHCPAAEHCNVAGDCVADLGNNAVCTANNECSSGICSVGFCAECTSDSHCPANENCNAGGDCAADVGNNAPCLRDAQCTTGICSAGFCAECTSHSDCSGTEWCNAGGDCANKVSDGTACTSNVVCLSGCCGITLVCGGLGC